jgi:hypothetical protein
MTVLEAYQILSAGSKALPWLGNLQIKSISGRDRFYYVTLIDGRKSQAMNPVDDLESAKFKKPKGHGYKGPRYQTAEEYRAEKGWNLTAEEYRDYNWNKRGGWSMPRDLYNDRLG